MDYSGTDPDKATETKTRHSSPFLNKPLSPSTSKFFENISRPVFTMHMSLCCSLWTGGCELDNKTANDGSLPKLRNEFHDKS